MHHSSVLAGIEIEESLYRIAVLNFQKMGLQGRVEIYNEDAVAFSKYSEFNVFYLFNSFDAIIYERVIDKIINEIQIGHKRNIYVICYGASVQDYHRKNWKD